jgi:ankyrin repeat protein
MRAIKHDELKTALHLAIEQNHRDVVKALLDRSPEVDAQDSSGFTPLHFAVSKGYFDIATMLLSHGADINRPSGKRGSTLLHHHTQKDNIDAVEFLLDHKANPNILNKKMKTPMYYAIKNSNPEIISLLNSAIGIPEFIPAPDEMDQP